MVDLTSDEAKDHSTILTTTFKLFSTLLAWYALDKLL